MIKSNLLVNMALVSQNAQFSCIRLTIVIVFKNLMQNEENHKQNACFLLASFTLDDIIINTNFEVTAQNDRFGKLLLLKLLFS